MSEKIMLVDVSKCTACRSCQVACKNWNGLTANQTHNRGSYQNPEGLGPRTYTLIRFQEEHGDAGATRWHFRNDKCYHCEDPGCMKVCPVPGCIVKMPSGAVVLDSSKCIGCKYCYHACPFSIPQYDAATDKMYKCTFCYDRLAEGLIPACAQACPTGALRFGDKSEMIAAAHARAKQLGNGAVVYGDKGAVTTHVIYVLDEEPAVYDNLPVNPRISPAIFLWKDLLKPLTMVSLLGGLGASMLYYFIKGPKHPPIENGGDDNG